MSPPRWLSVGAPYQFKKPESEQKCSLRTSARGAATTLAPVWTPPTTNLVVPTVFPDDIEVQVFATVTGAALVGAIELVSPSNKARPAARRAFENQASASGDLQICATQHRFRSVAVTEDEIARFDSRRSRGGGNVESAG